MHDEAHYNHPHSGSLRLYELVLSFNACFPHQLNISPPAFMEQVSYDVTYFPKIIVHVLIRVVRIKTITVFA